MNDTPAKVHSKWKKIFDITMAIGFLILFPSLIGWYHYANGKFSETPFSLIIWIFGMLVGTLMAMIFTPFSKEEKTNFDTLSTAIVSFLTGYLTSKVFDLQRGCVRMNVHEGKFNFGS